MMCRFLACFLFMLFTCAGLQAQFISSIKTLKRNHLVGEPVMVRVTITNYTGKEQILQGQRMPWISFLLKTSNGNPIISRQATVPKPVRIAPGQTLARDFNLSRQFQLNEVGNYSVSAVIRPQNNKLVGTTTQRTQFEMSAGRIYWSQKVGGVGPTESNREYRLVQFRSDKATQLYIQIHDDASGQILRTTPLGNILLLRKPSITVDGDRNLNLLFLTNPSTYLHYCIAPDGEIVVRDMHLRAATGDPKLKMMQNGAVIVTNSIYHDPELAAKQRAMIRKITDRP